MSRNSMRENRETPSTPAIGTPADRLEKAKSSKTSTHVGGESDGV